MKNFARRAWLAASLAMVLAGGCASVQNPGAGGAKNDIVGTWKLAANTQMKPDGSRADIFGANPSGMAIFAPDGRFMVLNSRSSIPRFASGNRLEGTAEENQAVVRGSIALFGTYNVDPATKVVMLNIETSTWPAWTGTSQKRIYKLDGDQLSWTLAASVGGTAEVVWKRMR